MIVDSEIRTYVPKAEHIKKFIEISQNISEKDLIRIEDSVDYYLDQLKKSLPSLEERITPILLKQNELPLNFDLNAPKTTRKLSKIFEKTNYFKSNQKKLSSNLPNIFISQKFKNYIQKSKEKIPKILEEAKISLPPDEPLENHFKRKKIKNLILRCANEK